MTSRLSLLLAGPRPLSYPPTCWWTYWSVTKSRGRSCNIVLAGCQAWQLLPGSGWVLQYNEGYGARCGGFISSRGYTNGIILRQTGPGFRYLGFKQGARHGARLYRAARMFQPLLRMTRRHHTAYITRTGHCTCGYSEVDRYPIFRNASVHYHKGTFTYYVSQYPAILDPSLSISDFRHWI